jgi:hypothetical protein
VAARSNQIKVFVACIFTATFIWLMDAINTGVHTVRINYPVRFVYDDSLYVGPRSLPGSVGLQVSGKGWKLLTRYIKSFSDTPVYYTFSNPLKASEIDTSQLKATIARQFDGFQVGLLPDDWPQEAKFELKAYKVVHLRIDSAAIHLMPGYAVTSYINMSPSLVSLEGPSSEIRTIPDSLVIPIPDRDIRANYESKLPLVIASPPSVKVSHESVYVSFEVSEIL